MCQEGPRTLSASTRGLPLVLGRAPPPVLMSRGPGSPGRQAARAAGGARLNPSPAPEAQGEGVAGGLPRRTRRLQCRVQETIQLNRPEPSDCAARPQLEAPYHPSALLDLRGPVGPGPPLDHVLLQDLSRAARGTRTRALILQSLPPVSPSPHAHCRPEPSWSRTGTCHAFRAAEPERPGAALGPERPGPQPG